MDVPASELFENFDAVSRQVTLLHYEEDMGLPLPMIQLHPAEWFFEKETPAAIPEPNLAAVEAERQFGPPRLSLKK